MLVCFLLELVNFVVAAQTVVVVVVVVAAHIVVVAVVHARAHANVHANASALGRLVVLVHLAWLVFYVKGHTLHHSQDF